MYGFGVEVRDSDIPIDYIGRRENCMGIVNDRPLRVLSPSAILGIPMDGGVLNPQKKR
ncbi:MAG: hypothetical protein F6K17_08560 [Okeania sp. SIO3C4]|nr:hypothetical protein [Okeania sp. SIO3B3]NER02674.1 hypothetical protein [Okeania sp. SIO3C4]